MNQILNESQGTNQEPVQRIAVQAPLSLQIISGLMYVEGTILILIGIPLLIFFGLGIISIMLGVYNFRYGNEILKMQANAYKRTLFLQSAIVEISVILWILSRILGHSNNYLILGVFYGIIVGGAVYLTRSKLVVDQDTKPQKVKINILVKVGTVLAVIIVITVMVRGCQRSLSGGNLKEKYPKYNEKIYSVASTDGKVQGYIATRIIDHAPSEFPSGIFNFDTYFNFIIHDPLNIKNGTMTFDDSNQANGEVLPALCNVNLTEINLFASRAHAINSPFRCGSVKKPDTPAESYFGTGYKTYLENNLEDVPNTSTINIYDDTGKLVKTYQVTMTPTNKTSNSEYLKPF